MKMDKFVLKDFIEELNGSCHIFKVEEIIDLKSSGMSKGEVAASGILVGQRSKSQDISRFDSFFDKNVIIIYLINKEEKFEVNFYSGECFN